MGQKSSLNAYTLDQKITKTFNSSVIIPALSLCDKAFCVQ